ncbi:hypothetical protein [Streptomyces sp. NPDC007172]|uniref:hypothetical protein n=1 Tax=Streptomyces sp. NPDC007172 TaxID=3364776 RepID=UPI0036AA3F21
MGVLLPLCHGADNVLGDLVTSGGRYGAQATPPSPADATQPMTCYAWSKSLGYDILTVSVAAPPHTW